MTLVLDAPARNLPLAFQVHAHLQGDLTPYLSRGRPIQSGLLDAALIREGVGLKTVRVEGFFAPHGPRVAINLEPWADETQVPGTLETQALASIVYVLARQLVDSFPAGETPPEVYVTTIAVIPVGQKKPAKKKARPAPKIRKQIRYRDSRTGHYVSAAVWKRERTRLRKAGKKGTRGRYRRVREIHIY